VTVYVPEEELRVMDDQAAEMNDNMNQYRDIIDMIQAAPGAPLPDHFTQNVIARLAVMNPSGVAAQPRWARLLSVSDQREGAFCFLITGFFYLIMGIILLAGFKAVGSGIGEMEWIKLQPHITIGMAAWLLISGGLLIADGRTAIKVAQYGTLLFIFFAVMNGILMRPYLRVPHADVFITGFVAVNALMGVMLSLAARTMEVRHS